VVIRLARAARLLGVLAHRVSISHDMAQLPERVQRHLHSGLLEARFRRQKTLHLLHVVAPLLRGHPGPWVLLKGAAYIAQELPISHGRLPADVDLMVPRQALDGVERSLLDAGWEFQKTDPYDQHYYRAWSHELPPLLAAGQALELDLHHTILPPTGRIRPDTESLFAEAVPVAGFPFHSLGQIDQLLHAAIHLTQDSDFVGRLRDLVDIDGLFRLLPLTDPQRIGHLVNRARHHGMEKPLWLAAALCDGWLGTPGCNELMRAIRLGDLSESSGEWVARLASAVLGPPDPDLGQDRRARVSGRLLELRALWLRMPPWLLAYHGVAKGLRTIRTSRDRRDK
jgi:hypothetical protein